MPLQPDHTVLENEAYINNGKLYGFGDLPIEPLGSQGTIEMLTALGIGNKFTIPDGRISSMEFCTVGAFDLSNFNLTDVNVSVLKGTVTLPLTCLTTMIPSGHMLSDEIFVGEHTTGIGYIRNTGVLIITLPDSGFQHEDLICDIGKNNEIRVSINTDLVKKIISTTIKIN